jgi:GNAT superfamily N-acetyltransferase
MRAIMNDAAFAKNGYTISAEKALLDFDIIYKYLSEDSYWAKGITADRFKTAIENSVCFGVYHNNMQAGFARVITDKATFAYLCDVFILSEYRGHGLSKWLIQTIVESPKMKGLRRFLLATADAHGLYSQFGFTQIRKPDSWMEIFTPYLKD